VSIVWAWRESVAEYVSAGQAVVAPLPECPACHRRLGKWSGYWRWVRYPVDLASRDSSCHGVELVVDAS
jgi:hypothetical protein